MCVHMGEIMPQTRRENGIQKLHVPARPPSE
jgi:hypothetical protein